MVIGNLEFLARLHAQDASQVMSILPGNLRVSALDCLDKKTAARHEHYCTLVYLGKTRGHSGLASATVSNVNGSRRVPAIFH
jgi:hypothetical protein